MPRHPLYRLCRRLCTGLLVLPLLACAAEPATPLRAPEARPLVIGHRGASGYVPEHTLASYALAVLQGADYIEPDLVMTRDGQLIARHDNELGLTTDVAQHPEFAGRKRTQTVDGVAIEGWFSEDFTLAEIKRLRAIERIPQVRPGNARLDGAFPVPTLQEIIDLARSLELSQGRRIGLYLETKHPSHFQHLGLGLERPLVRTLQRNGYGGRQAPVYLQSFEVDNLKTLARLASFRLVQLYGDGQPYDQVLAGSGLTYAQMATPAGLAAVARYADAVGPDKRYVIPRDAAGDLGAPTRFVADAHRAGLRVHPYTFRAENAFLPARLRSSERPEERGDLGAELKAFLAAGVDGVFTDQPDLAVRLREGR
ncbi:glycerophosphodiester phosphodiesterase [Pseudomonas mangiferae]|uniref:glycerophosphodiester phosphodiesterase n=1 Tax=Pseudomonas mangiferae TaxID=2593654 RepID=A0A553GTW1_9PSED|nr:glycerophosphodiester phosphodiesterase [Pseudomonas mangiferae]TRX72901.1 glycerophosphodiester phosphodiesterase [Pseudomonas mangiferae]